MKSSELFGLVISGMVFGLAQGGETLIGYTPAYDALTFQVASGGCTNKSDMEVHLRETNPIQLELVRVNPDLCEAYLPFGTEITYTYEELGLRPGNEFFLVNKVGTLTRVPD